jgi:hypothetical protein
MSEDVWMMYIREVTLGPVVDDVVVVVVVVEFVFREFPDNI